MVTCDSAEYTAMRSSQSIQRRREPVRVWIPVAAIMLAACPTPPPKDPAPSQSNVVVVAEPPVEVALRDANDLLQKRELAGARSSIGRMLIGHPDHLEGRALQAMIFEALGDAREAAKSWARVERIMVYQGKQVPFDLQETLHSSALHYFKVGRLDRGRQFLDELWRRFPSSDWSVKAQLALGETEFHRARWSHVIQACTELARLRPTHTAVGRCRDLNRAARRMLEVGPEPSADAARWDWEHPLPQGNDLHDLWVSPGGEAIAVGDAGTILARHPGGKGFTVQRSPTRWALHGIGGAAIDSLYAVGAAGIVLRFDGKQWSVARKASPERPDLWALYSTGVGHLVAVGEGGTLVELKDGAWSERRVASVGLHGVWGADGALYAVGDGGTLLQARDGRWVTLGSDCYEDLWSVWGLGEAGIWAVGNRRTVVHFDGSKAKESIVGRAHFRDVWGVGGKIWAVGTSGDIATFDGKSWRSETSGTLVDLHGVAGAKAGELWAVGDGGTILQRRGKGWAFLAGGIPQRLVAVSTGPTAGSAIALGESGGLLRRIKGHWRPEVSLPAGRYRDLWSDGQRTIVVGERGLLMIRKGQKPWQRVVTDTPEDLSSVWGWDGGAVAVGTRGTVVRLLGDRVTKDDSGTGLDLRGVWGTSARSLYAVGNRGAIIRYDGERWSEQESGTLADLHAVWGSSPRSVYAVGATGTIVTLDRGKWRPVSSPVSQTLVDVWGSLAVDRVFAVSDRGGIVQYDGTSWKTLASPTSCLSAIHGDPSTGVIAVGCHGTILRLVPPSR
jgi:hypothetical protein